MSQPPLIELDTISYSFSGEQRPILHDLNFVIGNEKIGLIGPNGCGKTTLFHIIMGLLTPTSGRVLFRGKVVSTQEQFKPLRREVGFLFQSSDDQLFSPTVLEDVAFGPLNLGFSVDEARHIAVTTLAKLGLKGFENRITHKLSGGEKKLVALATILSMKPQLLLLDEPTNNLDLEILSRLTDILNGLQLPFIIISHDWDFLAETTSVLYTIEHGHLHKCGKGHIHEHRHIHPYGNHPHQHKD
jgi:cobalt/nickel transport system ATP-binding protein